MEPQQTGGPSSELPRVFKQAAHVPAHGSQESYAEGASVMSPAYARPLPASNLSVRVHGTGPLVPHLLLTNPVVRLHVVSAATGEYSGMRCGGEAGARQLLDGMQQAELLDYPGRPTLTTVDNNTVTPHAALLEYLPPVQTKPCDLIGRPEAALAARWEEELLVDAAHEALAASDALLLFELLQPPASFTRYKRHVADYDKASGGGHAVAWGFLRLSGYKLPITRPRTMQLQLYEYSTASPHFWSRQQQPLPPNLARSAYASWREGPGNAIVAAAATPTTQGTTPLAAAILGSRQEATRYPASLRITLAVMPRQLQGVMVTDPFAGVRPALPAGYGSGFEIGRMPISMLGLDSRRLASTLLAHQHSPAAQAAAVEAQDPLEAMLHRPHTSPCQPPNALAARIKGTPGGCSVVAFSKDGRWLAAACADADGRFKVALYQALTGRLAGVLGTHDGLVYCLTWARDDSALVTTSADYTAKVWYLVTAPTAVPASPGAAPVTPYTVTAAAAGATSNGGLGLNPVTPGTSAAHMGAYEGVQCTVLQHTCYVYAAEFYPVSRPGTAAVVVTGGYDRVLRLFNASTGQVIYSLKPHDCYINSLAFDSLGSHLYAGDAAGAIQEYSVDLTGSCPEPIKKLRSSDDVAGAPISQLLLHPGAHYLIVLTKRNRLVALDLKMLVVVRVFREVRCSSHPLKAAVSPDGEWLICGSEDGSVTLWDFETATPTPMPHLALGSGNPVYCLSWSYSFQAVAACSFSHYAPIKVVCFDEGRAPVDVQRPTGAAAAHSARRVKVKRHQHTYELPERLTPQHVRALLADVRTSARQRGLYKAPEDPDGEHLVVPEARAGAAWRHSPGWSAANSAGDTAGGCASNNSIYGDGGGASVAGTPRAGSGTPKGGCGTPRAGNAERWRARTVVPSGGSAAVALQQLSAGALRSAPADTGATSMACSGGSDGRQHNSAMSADGYCSSSSTAAAHAHVAPEQGAAIAHGYDCGASSMQHGHGNASQLDNRMALPLSAQAVMKVH